MGTSTHLSFVSRYSLLILDRMDRNKSAALTVILELHLAGDLREQRVILAQADVEAGLVLASALADENRAPGHEVAVEALDAEPLRVAVAAVTRRSLSFFCRHDYFLNQKSNS